MLKMHKSPCTIFKFFRGGGEWQSGPTFSVEGRAKLHPSVLNWMDTPARIKSSSSRIVRSWREKPDRTSPGDKQCDVYFAITLRWPTQGVTRSSYLAMVTTHIGCDQVEHLAMAIHTRCDRLELSLYGDPRRIRPGRAISLRWPIQSETMSRTSSCRR